MMIKTKNVALVAIVVLLLLGNAAFTKPQPLYIQGDLSGDYRVTSVDCKTSMDIALGIISPTSLQKLAGDMNKDNRINSADVAIICRMAK